MQDHAATDVGDTSGGLLERESTQARVAQLAAAAAEGHGALAVVIGGAGEGKTALLSDAATLGERLGLRVWRATGSDLERSFAFGVVRQLLVGAVVAIEPSQRQDVFKGAARLAASVLDLDEQPQPLDPFAAQHGLYWLLVALAGRGTLMLIVDDAHWADQPSLGWLASLQRRVEELPVLVLLGTRPLAFDGAGDPLTTLLSNPETSLLRVGTLGRDSIATLARRELGAEPDPPFADACHQATGGNPFAVIELLRDLRRTGAKPDSSQAQRLGQRAPDPIARHVRGRLERLGPAAIAVAQALAVLGDRAQLRHVAALAKLEPERTGELTDALTLAGVLADADELRFEHPLVHAAVRDAITLRRRATLHAHAATLLAAEHADPEAIAAHLLSTDPTGDLNTVQGLQTAATAAIYRGSPDTAVTYLERALTEPPPPAMRSIVLTELGRAVWTAGRFDATAHIQAARELADDPRERARLDVMLADACFYGGERDRTFAVLQTGLRDLGDRDEPLALELRAMRSTALATMDSGWPAADDAEHEQLIALAGPTSQMGRQLQLSLALVGVWTGRRTAPETVEQVESALDEAMTARLDPGSTSRLAHGLIALIYADRPERAIELANLMVTHAAAHGIAAGLGLAYHVRGCAELHSGALADAEASAGTSLEITIQHHARLAEPLVRATLGTVLIKRGRVDEATEVLSAPLPSSAGLTADYFMRAAMARLHDARGEREQAITELETVGELATRHGMRNPAYLPWRSQLVYLVATDHPERAHRLATSELGDARRLQLPSAIGAALRARAMTEHDTTRETTLHQAITCLRQSPARLELTHTLIDFGAHLRRTGHRRDARPPLRQALQLAHQTAAQPLIDRATDELRAADGRPRSPYLTGAAALTPSELRVARLAAAGHTNQQIAQTVFTTTKTVEMHLTNTYRKLGTNTRTNLTHLLQDEPESGER
jgi:DNA-binding CsgD family transcriptional regulator